MIIFLFAILIHLLHGMVNVGSLVIYSAAAYAVASTRSVNQNHTSVSRE